LKKQKEAERNRKEAQKKAANMGDFIDLSSQPKTNNDGFGDFADPNHMPKSEAFGDFIGTSNPPTQQPPAQPTQQHSQQPTHNYMD
jgi:hypothetical protein